MCLKISSDWEYELNDEIIINSKTRDTKLITSSFKRPPILFQFTQMRKFSDKILERSTIEMLERIAKTESRNFAYLQAGVPSRRNIL